MLLAELEFILWHSFYTLIRTSFRFSSWVCYMSVIQSIGRIGKTKQKLSIWKVCIAALCFVNWWWICIFLYKNITKTWEMLFISVPLLIYAKPQLCTLWVFIRMYLCMCELYIAYKIYMHLCVYVYIHIYKNIYFKRARLVLPCQLLAYFSPTCPSYGRTACVFKALAHPLATQVPGLKWHVNCGKNGKS